MQLLRFVSLLFIYLLTPVQVQVYFYFVFFFSFFLLIWGDAVYYLCLTLSLLTILLPFVSATQSILHIAWTNSFSPFTLHFFITWQWISFSPISSHSVIINLTLMFCCVTVRPWMRSHRPETAHVDKSRLRKHQIKVMFMIYDDTQRNSSLFTVVVESDGCLPPLRAEERWSLSGGTIMTSLTGDLTLPPSLLATTWTAPVGFIYSCHLHTQHKLQTHGRAPHAHAPPTRDRIVLSWPDRSSFL